MITILDIAKAFATTDTKAELEFCLVEMFKNKGLNEDMFWKLVADIRKSQAEKV